MKNRWDDVTQDELDEMVHDAKSGEAASINNRGRDAQIDFLDDFPHLSEEQKEDIHNRILSCDLSAARDDEGYLSAVIADRWANESLSSKINALSSHFGDTGIMKEDLGFDPWEGEGNE